MTADKREAAKGRKLLRSVAVMCSILLALISLQTAIASDEVDTRTTLAVTAKEGSMAASVAILDSA